MKKHRRYIAGACDACSGAARTTGAVPDDAHTDQESRSYKGVAVGAGASGAMAVGAVLLSAVAVGAVAIGAVAIGALAIKRLSVKRSKFDRLDIDDLAVRRLRVEEVILTKRPVISDDTDRSSNEHHPNADGLNDEDP